MDSVEKEKLKDFMYWLSDYEGWQDVKTVVLLAEYEAYLENK